jgi:GAF domain-containing protein
MMLAERPINEAERQADLLSFEILDSAPDPRFDTFVRLASIMFDAPIALVSLVDGDRQWFKAAIGTTASETPRGQAFCAHAILTPDKVFVVNDALADARFSDNPLVTDGPKIRFYAGAPIISQAGSPLGTLCIIDTQPRAFDEASKRQLADLALGVGSTLELHRNARRLSQALDARRHGEQLFDLVWAAVDAAVAVIEDDACIVTANASLHAMLGYPAGALAGRAITSIIASGFHQALRPGETYELPVRLLDHAGREIPARLKFVAARRPDGTGHAVVTIHAGAEAPARPCPAMPAASLPGAESEPAPPVHVAGSIQLIGLPQIRGRLGEAWAAVAERALQTAEHVIKRRIGPHDIWWRAAGESFIICFAAATEEEAAARSAAIARDIRIRLSSHGDDPAMAQVTAVTAATGIDPETCGADDLAPLVQQRLDDQRSRIEDQARQTLAVLMAEPGWRCIPVHVSGSDRLFGHQLSLLPATEQRLLTALAALPGSGADGLCVSAMLLEMLVTHSQCLPGGMIIVSVDYEVFSSKPATGHYLRLCAGLSPEFSQNLVMVLSNVPPNLAWHHLGTCLNRLRPFCYRVVLALNKAELPEVRIGAPLILTIPSSRLLRGGGLQTPRLARFLLSVAMHKAVLIVTEVPDAATAARLHAAGIKLLSMSRESAAPQ